MSDYRTVGPSLHTLPFYRENCIVNISFFIVLVFPLAYQTLNPPVVFVLYARILIDFMAVWADQRCTKEMTKESNMMRRNEREPHTPRKEGAIWSAEGLPQNGKALPLVMCAWSKLCCAFRTLDFVYQYGVSDISPLRLQRVNSAGSIWFNYHHVKQSTRAPFWTGIKTYLLLSWKIQKMDDFHPVRRHRTTGKM